MDFNSVSLIGVFLIMLAISSVLNILLKTTSKLNWIVTFLFCISFSVVFTALFNTN
ncbi:hypothetical protein P6709_09840 [Jeotgalibacillus sp. ET6]|uniref:hypothetical protein n=1 Tax=Jeotgalibacillus sp. ET6 TaxID=3037260 RepID=UPI002418A97E|nr:hypothetical protein [Jeotgalibacillus sp. ET6]MDG5472052.1 hypothetical protein [Jeotgalibacillus sp. ET6]